MSFALNVSLAVAGVATAAVIFTTFQHPPVDSVQRGYRGVGLEQNYDPKLVAASIPQNQIPKSLPQLPASGPKAGAVYKNVKVLGDLSVGQFTRLMASITTWVSPAQGCAYCHNVQNMADDSLYTKVVSRRMIQMVQNINGNWKNHVQATGVTCWTCHRGNPVPANIWFTNPGPGAKLGGMAESASGRGTVSTAAGLSSLPLDPFTPYLQQAVNIRVQGVKALPGDNTHTIKQAEWTYALMMHFSTALGVNCTYCHNSRAFSSWAESSPQRTSAWWGIRMVREANNDYLTPLTSVFPPNRLGLLGDAPKVNCTTCHQGVYKPLYGVSMLPQFPELAAVHEASRRCDAGAGAMKHLQPADLLAVPTHGRSLPLRAGTRGSPLALVQTRAFLALLGHACPALDMMDAFQEVIIRTTGDAVQDRPLAEIGGKGLFAKEIHEQLLSGEIDLAVHSLKDLDTELPKGVAIACFLTREDPRDCLILGPTCSAQDPADPLSVLPYGAVIGTCSVRRQAQLMDRRPDLTVVTLRGNVQTRLAKVASGECHASLLALAGLRRLGLAHHAGVVLDPEDMLPASGQGIVAVTVRADDHELLGLLDAVSDPAAKAAAIAERAVLAALDGSCRTPIGAYARMLGDGTMRLTGLIARPDGTFLRRRSVVGLPHDAARLGAELGATLRAECPEDLLHEFLDATVRSMAAA